jgi:hypothetical protein
VEAHATTELALHDQVKVTSTHPVAITHFNVATERDEGVCALSKELDEHVLQFHSPPRWLMKGGEHGSSAKLTIENVQSFDCQTPRDPTCPTELDVIKQENQRLRSAIIRTQKQFAVDLAAAHEKLERAESAIVTLTSEVEAASARNRGDTETTQANEEESGQIWSWLTAKLPNLA